MDQKIGSCSILPGEFGTSPKEFLFLMAFALPCCAIVLCYARIFYIVRRTAIKAQDIEPKQNGFAQTDCKRRNNNIEPSDKNTVTKNIPIALNDMTMTQPNNEGQYFDDKRNEGQNIRKFLSKAREDDLKFIDTSIESDLPPTLSQLQRKRVELADGNRPSIMLTISTTEHLNNEQLDSIRNNECDREKLERSSPLNEFIYDSAASDIQVEQNEINNTNIKHKELKDDHMSSKYISRKKSLANSGASILYAGKLSSRDRRLLKMILVIFISFLTCYLPITLTKVLNSISENNFIFISGYLLVYLTTIINPLIYVLISKEYRQAYKNLLMCRSNNSRSIGTVRKYMDSRRR